MGTMTAAAMSSMFCTSSLVPLNKVVLRGASQLCCRTVQQHLNTRVVQRIDRKIGRSFTMAQASAALKMETENSSDDSLEAAVKGLEINRNRPDDKLPYGGVWLNVGSPSQMIHLMELPNPDPKEGRPQHGGRDRHACLSVKDVMKVKEVFDKADIPYTFSASGRPAIFVRDPDGNALEFSQLE